MSRAAAGAAPLRAILFALFAASGFAGLIYESIWAHYLGLFLGHAAYAQTLVLAIFMGGMALGSWLASRLSPRWERLLAAYALTEAAIGVLGLVFHEIFTGATGLAYAVVLPRIGASAAGVALFKWALSAALILPQSVLLGMTFPLMTAGVLRAFGERPGRSVAMLYFTNSLGAAAGVLVSGFVLVRAFGLPGTVRAAGLVNLAVAGLVWRLARAREQAAPAPAKPALARDRAWRAFLAVSLVTGASSFIYEVSWIRMLSLVLGSSTHSFELMLSAFILGLALGGLWIQRRIDALPSATRTLAVLQVAMGLLALATLLVYGQAFHAMQWLRQHAPRTPAGYGWYTLAANGIALAVMLPATFCAGTTLPLITFRLLKRGHGEASIGAVYAANTVGAIAAVFFAIHLGLPLLGLRNLVVLGGALDIALGVALALRIPRLRGGLALAGALGVAFTLGFVRLDPLLMASGVYRSGRLLQAGDRVLFQRDGKTASVTVLSRKSDEREVRTNGKTDASLNMHPEKNGPTVDEPTMVLLAAVPMSYAPQARRAACIGFGSGLTTQVLLENPRLERVDTVEIEREMVRAAQQFRPRNELAFTDPRSQVVIDDAKTFFASRPEPYDLIVSEPSNPWVSGVSGLFSTEFYGLVKRHLSQGGVFVQWLQLYEIDVPLVTSVLRALDAHFDDWAAYATNDADLMIIARQGGALGTPDPRVLMNRALTGSLLAIGVRNLQDFEVRRAGTKKSWAGLLRSFAMPANSDYHPVLDQGADLTRFLEADAGALTGFERDALPAVELLSGVPRPGPFTSVSEAPWSDASRRGREAMWLREVVLLRLDPARRYVESDALHGDAGGLARWLRTCEGPFPLGAFIHVAQRMLPELTTQDADAVWDFLESRPCAARIDPPGREWIALMKAVGAREPAGMAAAARALLAHGAAPAPSAERYLLAAGMLGSVAQGDGAGARQLWSAHPRVAAKEDLLLRTLAAEAGF